MFTRSTRTTSGLVSVTIGEETFAAHFRDDLAPRTCNLFRRLLPLRKELLHARWSGEACWVPLGNLGLGMEVESPTSHPAPGDFIFYPGGISETELLFAYGIVRFASVAGPLSGTPFITITDGLDRLARAGREILWSGVRRFSIAEPGLL